MSINTNYGMVSPTGSSYQFKNSLEYSKYLTNKYKCLTPCKSASVTIDASVMRKAAGDKKTAEWLEENLSVMPDIFRKAQSLAAARGSTLISAEFRFTSEGTEMITSTVSGETKADSEIDKWLEGIEKDTQDVKKHKNDTLEISTENNGTEKTGVVNMGDKKKVQFYLKQISEKQREIIENGRIAAEKAAVSEKENREFVMNESVKNKVIEAASPETVPEKLKNIDLSRIIAEGVGGNINTRA